MACGEIGLAGELRQASQMERRLSEAARVGFTTAVIPVGSPPTPEGILGLRAETLTEALHLTNLLGGSGFNAPRQDAARSVDESDLDWADLPPLRSEPDGR